MAVRISLEPKAQPEMGDFVEKHLVKIAFAISAVVSLVLAPLTFFLGSAIGFFVRYQLEPNLVVKKEAPLVSIPHALFTIIGAVANLLKLVPAGTSGGFIFKMISPLSSLFMGSFIYESFRRVSQE